MHQSWRVYKAFISSPSDVSDERLAAESLIAKVDNSLGEILRMHVKSILWENLPPLTPEIKIQEDLNNLVKDCNFFILILYKRYGNIEPGQVISNTEREVNTILKRYNTDKRIKILAFFRYFDPSTDPGTQETKLIAFQKRLSELNIHYTIYRDLNDFMLKLCHALYEVIIRMHLSTFKQKALREFWKIGFAEKAYKPNVAIIYPPVGRKYMDTNNDPEFWLRRLAPHIIFEDYISLHKVVKNMAIIGNPDYKIYTSNDITPNINHINRIWICVPRSKPAKRQLARYSEVLRFNIIDATNSRFTKILWNCNASDSVDKFEIESPLYKYMVAQRTNMGLSGEWKTVYGNIVAKDYAVLARLKDSDNSEYHEGGPIWDYFMAGIRGLGTWGATWFIDRCYPYLYRHFRDIENIQLLLEVTYLNRDIFSVVDVSDKPQSYFRNENTMATIKMHIKEMSP